jgi:G3E family GTPase
MNLDGFFRGDLDGDPGAALRTLIRAILIRTQFLPTVRHVIGWRGLQQVSAEREAWTARIGGYTGVFGLFFLGLEPAAKWATGRFGLCYFPDAEEPLVERCSLKAAAFTQAGDYRGRIRDFARHPEMCGLFGIGSLLLSVRGDRRSLALVLESPSSLRTVASDGVQLVREGRSITMVEPGGVDQNFPAFETARAFFDVLAASVGFNLEQPPNCLIERRYPAARQVYDRSGAVSSQDDPDLWNGFLVLGYGEGDFDGLYRAISSTKAPPISAVKADGAGTAPPEYQEKLWWRAHQLKDSRSIDKKILGVDERPPLILLTGFLGSGKTSFLQHFIEYQTQRSRFVAVIQNEIGEVGLDGKLLDYTVTEIDEGCVCCSLTGSLKRAVRRILENFSPDTIILETSGLANPLNLLEEMEELGEIVRFDSTVTLVDALNLDAALAGNPIAADQIRAADVIVLNKRDLVDDVRMETVRRRVGEINGRAPLFPTAHGDLNPALIFDAEDPSGPDPDGMKRGTGSGERAVSSTHPVHAEAGIWSRTLRLPGALDRGRFLQTVASLPASISRVKGLIDFTDSDRTMLFQYVCGRFELSVFPQRGVEERFLTFIGRENEPDARELLEALSPAPASGV